MKKAAMIFTLTCILFGCNSSNKVEDVVNAYSNFSFITVDESLTLKRIEMVNEKLKKETLNQIISNNKTENIIIEQLKITNKTLINDLLYIEIEGLKDFYIESNNLDLTNKNNFDTLFIRRTDGDYEVYMNTEDFNVFICIGKLVEKSSIK